MEEKLKLRNLTRKRGRKKDENVDTSVENSGNIINETSLENDLKKLKH